MKFDIKSDYIEIVPENPQDRAYLSFLGLKKEGDEGRVVAEGYAGVGPDTTMFRIIVGKKDLKLLREHEPA